MVFWTWNLRSLNIRDTENISKRISRAPIRFSGHTAGQMGATVALNEQAIIYIYIVLLWKWKWESSLGHRIWMYACTHTHIHKHKPLGSIVCYRWHHVGHWFCYCCSKYACLNSAWNWGLWPFAPKTYTFTLQGLYKNSDLVTRIPPIKCLKTRDLEVWAVLYFKMWRVQCFYC